MNKIKWTFSLLFLVIVCGSISISIFIFFSSKNNENNNKYINLDNPIEKVINKEKYMSHKISLINMFDFSGWDFKEVYNIKFWIDDDRLVFHDEIKYKIKSTFINNIHKLDLNGFNKSKTPSVKIELLTKEGKKLQFYLVFSYDGYNFYYDKLNIDFTNSFNYMI